MMIEDKQSYHFDRTDQMRCYVIRGLKGKIAAEKTDHRIV